MSENKKDWNVLALMITEVSDEVKDWKEINKEMLLNETLNISSIMTVNLIVDLENAFNIKIKESDFGGISKVGDIWQLVLKRKSGLD